MYEEASVAPLHAWKGFLREDEVLHILSSTKIRTTAYQNRSVFVKPKLNFDLHQITIKFYNILKSYFKLRINHLLHSKVSYVKAVVFQLATEHFSRKK